MCVPGFAQSRYVNLYTDFAFKKIFGTEANKDLLINFLNQLLQFHGDDAIRDVTYLNAEQLGSNANERRAVYDVFCTTEKGEQFIVEMQKAKQDNFKDRALYYSSFAIREQGSKGSASNPWDYSLMPVYVVGILNFTLDDMSGNDVITRVTLKDEKNNVFSKNLQFIFVEMPKFGKSEEQLDSFLDKWLFVIQNMSRLDDKPAALTEAIFLKLFKESEIAQFSKVERAEYEESLKVFWDFSNVLGSAERKGLKEGLKKGVKKGLEKGRKEGRIEGLAEGLAKGREEGEKETNIRNAKNLKSLGVDVETISKATGLSLDEVKSL